MKEVLAVVLAAVLIGCLTPPSASVTNPGSVGLSPGEDTKYCKVDADCVKEQCCHPTGAVNVLNAPDCRDVSCTQECRPNTLDCGGGTIQCVGERCTVILY